MIDALTFDIGGVCPTSLRLVSSDGLSPLLFPVPNDSAVDRFAAAMAEPLAAKDCEPNAQGDSCASQKPAFHSHHGLYIGRPVVFEDDDAVDGDNAIIGQPSDAVEFIVPDKAVAPIAAVCAPSKTVLTETSIVEVPSVKPVGVGLPAVKPPMPAPSVASDAVAKVTVVETPVSTPREAVVTIAEAPVARPPMPMPAPSVVSDVAAKVTVVETPVFTPREVVAPIAETPVARQPMPMPAPSAVSDVATKVTVVETPVATPREAVVPVAETSVARQPMPMPAPSAVSDIAAKVTVAEAPVATPREAVVPVAEAPVVRPPMPMPAPSAVSDVVAEVTVVETPVATPREAVVPVAEAPVATPREAVVPVAETSVANTHITVESVDDAPVAKSAAIVPPVVDVAVPSANGTKMPVTGASIVESPVVEPPDLKVYGQDTRTVGLNGESAKAENGVLPAHPYAGTILPVFDSTFAQEAVQQVSTMTARTETLVETVNQIAETIVGQIEVTPSIVKGEGKIYITLKPTVLDGSMISLSAKDGELTVAIAPSTPEAETIAAAMLPRLETALAEHASAFRHVAVALTIAKKGKTDETA